MTRKRGQEVKGGFPKPWEKVIGRDLEEGDEIEGFYRGYDNVKAGNRYFVSYRFQPEGAGDSPSDWVGIAGGTLKSIMERIPEGTYCWITYLGVIKASEGDAKSFKVETEEGTKLLPPKSASDGEHAIPEGA